MAPYTKVLLMTCHAFFPLPRCGKSMCPSSPCVIMTFWFLDLMTIDAPVLVGMASFAVIFIVIGLAAVFEHPAWVFVIYPPFLMIEWHAIFFNVFMANITGDFIFTPFFVTWHTIAIHIG